MLNGYLIAKKAISSERDNKERVDKEFGTAIRFCIFSYPEIIGIDKRDLLASRHKERMMIYIHNAVCFVNNVKLTSTRCETALGMAGKKKLISCVTTGRTTPREKIETPYREGVNKGNCYGKMGIELDKINISRARRSTSVSSPKPRHKLKTHFKEIVEMSNQCSTSFLPTPPTNSKSYIAQKLLEFRQKRLLGLGVAKSEIEEDDTLNKCLSVTAKEVVDVYQLRRERHTGSLLKGRGKLVWNHPKKARSHVLI